MCIWVSASSSYDAFPDISFKEFSAFVNARFSSHIPLSTVLVVLFTVTSNTDLLNLHSRQKNGQSNLGEHSIALTGWIKALVRALTEKLKNDEINFLFKSIERKSIKPEDDEERLEGPIVDAKIAEKLNALTELLNLNPCKQESSYNKPLKQISDIEPAYVVCPAIMHCTTQACRKRSITLDSRDRDAPRVTLIKGSKMHANVHLLKGTCKGCKTIYYADRESFDEDGEKMRFYLNTAKYLKLGQNIWADRTFSSSVVNGTYSFHASSSAYAEFWNDSFWSTQNTSCRKLSRRQVAAAYVQETIRRVAQSSGSQLIIPDNLPIDQVTKQAFENLGENGVIRSAQNHFCSECTHPYKAAADQIIREDPAALLGPDTEMAVENNQNNEQNAQTAPIIDREPLRAEEGSPVKMVVLDEIVMGPTVDNFFTAARFYCVETICAPCGVVIAWKTKAESPTNILNFLERVFPTAELRPNYICIDKACAVLRTAWANGSWDRIWKHTTRFIVDSYHYINHRTTDYLCRTMCNPAPLNGSAPNLVVVEYDNDNNPHYKRAFNTQACEQLNAWIGGFQSVLNKMTPTNFDCNKREEVQQKHKIVKMTMTMKVLKLTVMMLMITLM
ncbi:hypothetical protein BD410DRAFT_816582 [Rickenella mellea]|uniref:CxC5 like cysteine cluster associated with KDZ domain-containing protein n=1 Tax=Rickenella mellea TaxID=50990 RepID=A0A4Y7PQH2_9AGAM|nr:hypothetical protein BD410DRAFT_816582 [Rickenella mellea]